MQQTNTFISTINNPTNRSPTEIGKARRSGHKV